MRDLIVNEKLYIVWRNLKARCYNPNNDHYQWYGGKGIKVCQEWLESCDEFRNWALENGYVPGLTIERIDIEDGYKPSNCKWIPPRDQYLNRSDNTRKTAFNETKTLKEWSLDTRCEVSFSTLRMRLWRNGWSLEDSLLRDPYGVTTCKECGEDFNPRAVNNYFCSRKCVSDWSNRKNYVPTPVAALKWEAFGESKTVAEWSKDPRCVVSPQLIYSRLNHNWTMEITLTTPARKSPTRK